MVLGFGRAWGAGFAAVYRHPAPRVAGCEAPGILAVAGASVVGTGLGACLGDFARVWGGCVLDKDVVVEVDEVVMVVEAAESEAVRVE